MKIFKNKKFLLLSLILILAATLRLHDISNNPPSLTWDETAWGYNAYTLGIDGKDEFGRTLPLAYLESFGDYKPPAYAYLDIIPVKIFGLTPLAVRLPSALLGIATVLLSYFLVMKIFSTSKNAYHYALATSFILAISPWHIMLSRAAFEANIATFFIVLGVWLFLKSARDKSWLFLTSTMSFVLSFYTFNTARIVSPLLALLLTAGFHKDLLQMKKKVIVSAVVGIILLLPAIQFILSPQSKTRFNEVNIFSNIELIEASNEQIANDNNSIYSRILHNYRLIYATEFLSHYLDHFSPQYLFISGDGNPKFSTQQTGQLYIWDLPFLIIGLILLFRKREDRYWLVPLWLLIAIIPAGTARETPHALRTEATIPTFQILIAYGLVNSILWIRSKLKPNMAKILVLTIFALLGLSLLHFQNYYTNHYPQKYSGVWQYGYEQAFSYLEEQEDSFDRIYFNDVLGRPYIYYLFHRQKDPEALREDADIDRDVFGLVDVRRVENYYFVRDIHALPTENLRVLYVNVENAVPDDTEILHTIYSLEGNKQLIFYTR